MKLILSTHNVTLTKAIEDHVLDKLDKLERYDHRAIDARVTLENDQQPRAERAIEHAAESEGHKAVLIHCRRVAADAFYCQFEYAPLYNRHYHATVHFEGSHTYVGPIEETV